MQYASLTLGMHAIGALLGCRTVKLVFCCSCTSRIFFKSS